MLGSASCLDRCNHGDKQTCQCDAECEVFGDCCADFKTYCQVNSTLDAVVAQKNLSVCTKVYHNENVEVGYLLSKCPSSWSEPIVGSRCRSHSINMHVYDKHGNNYRNIYCALCHNRSVKYIWFWNIYDDLVSECPTDINGIAAASVKKETVPIRGKSFRRCFTGGKCPQTYSNISVVRLCSSYAYPVSRCHLNPRHLYVEFKNPHCALCNGYVLLRPRENCAYSRTGFLGQGMWQFSVSDKSIPSLTLPCPDGEGFDEISKVCRPIICSTGYSLNGFKCILNNNTHNLDFMSTLDCKERITYFLFRGDLSTRSCIVEEFESFFKDYDSRMFKQQASEFDDDLWIALKFTNENAREALQTVRNDKNLSILHDLSSCRLNEMEIIYTCSKNDHECNGQWISGSPTDFRRVFGVSNDSEVFLKDMVYFKPDIIIYTLKHELQIQQHTSYEVMLFCAHVINVPSLDCEMIELTKKEYSFNKSVIFYGEIKFKTDEYVILPNGNVQVCLGVIKHFSRKSKKVLKNYLFVSGALDAVHFSLSFLSIMGLFSTLVTYMQFKQLRNLHGVCIIGPSLALLLANTLSLLSDKIHTAGSLCITFAAITHYFWLAAFTWMTLISAVMIDTFVVNPSKPIRKSITAYSVVLVTGWSTPMLIVLLLLSLQFCKLCSFDIVIYDGASMCWLATPSINLYAFGIPVMISLTVNFILMSILMVSLHKAREASNKLQQKRKNQDSWKEALLCLKVSCFVDTVFVCCQIFHCFRFTFCLLIHRTTHLYYTVSFTNMYTCI